ncbi:hypothetical protein [Limosilactobacillus fermentum]|uniref:hypothetical protein n=1 Tax=Limosilactobacillus fermentum TaxID=1613 RepID=UPI000A7FB12F|nr:hypothetical protein [Limosilactobacillus fermentum]MCH5389215.1 hypothetical protein [Limosilactobacillus fermentum]MCH5393752.1 hypothetical protein [Limosilactobacillus fermentum]
MTMNDNQHFYSEVSNGTSTSRVQVEVDKITVSIKTKCPLNEEGSDGEPGDKKPTSGD